MYLGGRILLLSCMIRYHVSTAGTYDSIKKQNSAVPITFANKYVKERHSLRRTEQRGRGISEEREDWEQEQVEEFSQRNKDQEQEDQNDIKQNEDLWIKFASRREWSRKMSICYTMSGTISFISSIALVTVILRSYTRLGSTYHRLLLGLSISNVITSLIHSLNSILVPSDVDYMVWNARGNSASCTFNGFAGMIGGFMGILYNWALCFFYLAVIRYDGSDKSIETKLEPYLHAVAITYPLVMAVTLLALDAYHPLNTNCFVRNYNPPHCEGFEAGEIPPGYKIPCGVGREGNYLVYSLFSLPVQLAAPVVLTVTMTMCYRKVLQNEKKALKYGANQIRQSIAMSIKQNSNRYESDRRDGSIPQGGVLRMSMKKSVKGLRSSISYLTRHRSSSVKQRGEKSRLIFHRAVSYVMAYVLCYGLMTVLIIFRVTGVMIKMETSKRLYLAHAILSPLQGFFNFLIFLHPKVLNHKRNRKLNLSWTGAIIKAIKSRGSKPKQRWSGARVNSRKRELMVSKRISLQRQESARRMLSRRQIECGPTVQKVPTVQKKVESNNDEDKGVSANAYPPSYFRNRRKHTSVTFASNLESPRDSNLHRKSNLILNKISENDGPLSPTSLEVVDEGVQNLELTRDLENNQSGKSCSMLLDTSFQKKNLPTMLEDVEIENSGERMEETLMNDLDSSDKEEFLPTVLEDIDEIENSDERMEETWNDLESSDNEEFLPMLLENIEIEHSGKRMEETLNDLDSSDKEEVLPTMIEDIGKIEHSDVTSNGRNVE